MRLQKRPALQYTHPLCLALLAQGRGYNRVRDFQRARGYNRVRHSQAEKALLIHRVRAGKKSGLLGSSTGAVTTAYATLKGRGYSRVSATFCSYVAQYACISFCVRVLSVVRPVQDVST